MKKKNVQSLFPLMTFLLCTQNYLMTKSKVKFTTNFLQLEQNGTIKPYDNKFSLILKGMKIR